MNKWIMTLISYAEVVCSSMFYQHLKFILRLLTHLIYNNNQKRIIYFLFSHSKENADKINQNQLSAKGSAPLAARGTF